MPREGRGKRGSEGERRRAPPDENAAAEDGVGPAAERLPFPRRGRGRGIGQPRQSGGGDPNKNVREIAIDVTVRDA